MGWQPFIGRVAKCAAGMVARKGEKATDFRGFLVFVGVDDIGGSVGLVKPKRRGVVLVAVAVESGKCCRE